MPTAWPPSSKPAGVPDTEVTFSSIHTDKVFQRKHSRVRPARRQLAARAPRPAQLVATSKVELYVLAQSISIESHEMDKVPGVSRNITA